MKNIFRFFRRHWILGGLVLLLLFLLPPFLIVLYGIFNSLKTVAEMFLPTKMAEKVGSAIVSIASAITQIPYVGILFGIALSAILPPVGAIVAIWSLLDLFKSGVYSAKVESFPTQDQKTDVQQPANDFTIQPANN
jgi:hypothetical protein